MSDCSGLSGMYSGLSGEFVSLEARLDNLDAQILAFPTSADFNELTSLLSSRYNTVQEQLTSIVTRYNLLQAYVVNLNAAHLDLQTQFLSHTGLSAISGHNGLTG